MTQQIQLTERELSIIQFINEFGFCEIRHIMRRFQLGRSSCYMQMKLLERFGMVNHELVLPNQSGVYFLTSKAATALNTDLPTFTQIPKNMYVHQMAVIRTYLKVLEMHPDSEWITERKLIRQKCEDMRGSKEHLPDGILLLADKRRIPIEVELSLKARFRLLNILTDYAVDSSASEVWYFCSRRIKSILHEMTVKLPKIKIYLLDEE